MRESLGERYFSCFHSCLEFSQTFTGVTITLWKLGKKVFHFFYKLYLLKRLRKCFQGTVIRVSLKTQLFLSALVFGLHRKRKFLKLNAFPVWWINLKTHYYGRAKTELFENSEVTTVMCACARMLNHTLKRFWVRGSVSMWAKNVLSVFTKGLVCTENILCVFKIIHINADGFNQSTRMWYLVNVINKINKDNQ